MGVGPGPCERPDWSAGGQAGEAATAFSCIGSTVLCNGSARSYSEQMIDRTRALLALCALLLGVVIPTGLAQTGGATAASRDRVRPSTPGHVRVLATTATSLSVAWAASTDNVRVAGYRVYRGGAPIATLKARRLFYVFSGLTCAKSYTVAVQAKDAAGNRSRRGSLVAATSSCDPVIAAAGDICGSARDCAPTAALLDRINPTRVLTLGDNAYEDGAPNQYMRYYEPNWGRHKQKTSPTPGNHEYHTSGARGYFDYFGARAPAEYYSFDLGAWHLISLNSEISVSSGSVQQTWLKADLAAHPSKCILAYWHKPSFSSGSQHGGSSRRAPLWTALQAAGADVVLNGHEHNYERFARQDASGRADPRGIRAFVVGTGGAGLYSFGTPVANSEVRNDRTFGVLRLVLHGGSYEWSFVPVAGASFTDSGSQTC